MKKLNLEDLAVESFPTSLIPTGRGTVRGYQEEEIDPGEGNGESELNECYGGSVRSWRCSYVISLCWNMSCPASMC